MSSFKYLFLTIIVPGSILIPLLIFIPRYKLAKTQERILFYYLISAGLINLAAIILSMYGITNLPLLHLYTIVEAVFLLGYFRLVFNEPVLKKVIGILMVLFPIICVLNFSFLQSIYTFNTYTRPLEAILITFFCLLYLYKSGFAEDWIKQSTSWFNAGILIYFPAAFVIFVLSNYLMASKNHAMNTIVWNLHAALVLIMYLLWARGFRLAGNGR